MLCLQPEGVLPMMAYMRKFHTKGVPFSGFRYMKGRDLGILSLRSVAETPTSGDLKSGDSLFFTTPPPEFQQTPSPTPPDKLTQPPMRMTLDIAWSLTWIHTAKIRNHCFDARNNLCQWLNTCKNAPETVWWRRKIQVLS